MFPKRNNKFKKILWLDKAHNFSQSCLEKAKPLLINSPNIVQKHQSKTHNLLSPKIDLYRFEDASINMNGRYIVTNNYIIVERIKSATVEENIYSYGNFIYQGKKIGVYRQQNTLKIPDGCIVSCVNNNNYYHILIELLPQLFYLKNNPLIKIIYLPKEICKFAQVVDLLYEIQLKKIIIFLDSTKVYFINNCYYITSPNLSTQRSRVSGKTILSKYQYDRASLFFIKNTVINSKHYKALDKKFKYERIFLCRNNERRKYNQDCVIALLKKYNFTFLHTEKLSIYEQAYIFNHTKIIISPTGAALTNLLFCSQGVKILIWLPSSVEYDPCYNIIANLNQNHLDAITYETNSKTMQTDLAFSSYKININILKNWLETNI